MYKVFFNDRIVLLTDDFIRNFQEKEGLFYKFRDIDELKEVIDFFWEMKLITKLFIFHSEINELREKFKTCFMEINAAGGLVKNKDDKYLMIYRRDKWDLPKGKLNHNETHEDAALREVTEECGISDLKIISPLLSTYHCYLQHGQLVLKRTQWYEMYYGGHEDPLPQHDEDITEIKWFKSEDLHKLLNNTYPAIIDVLHYSNLL